MSYDNGRAQAIEPSTVDPRYWDSLDDSADIRAAELRAALLTSPAFVSDAMGSVPTDALIAAYIHSGDMRAAMDGIVGQHYVWWYAREEKHLRGPWHHKPSELEVVEAICREFGVGGEL